MIYYQKINFTQQESGITFLLFYFYFAELKRM